MKQQMPHFKYHPDPIKTGVFEKTDAPVVCDCCGQKTDINHSFSIVELKEKVTVNGEVLCPFTLFNGEAHEDHGGCYCWKVYLCPECFRNGKAYEKFGSEINNINDDNYRKKYTGVIDEDKIEELLRCTPGYPAWQYQVWPVHCDDFCAFIMRVHEGDLMQMGILEEITSYLREEGAFDEGDYGTKERLKDPAGYAESILTGGCDRYLFRCLHCGKYLLHYDYD